MEVEVGAGRAPEDWRIGGKPGVGMKVPGWKVGRSAERARGRSFGRDDNA